MILVEDLSRFSQTPLEADFSSGNERIPHFQQAIAMATIMTHPDCFHSLGSKEPILVTILVVLTNPI